eukprot:snap_masked-scaffold_58-processed-gene-0.63-mRNA-1 protein AED:0.01 eAED:0.01 QI:0/-1/0/1/-1/1/1/0/585
MTDTENKVNVAIKAVEQEDAVTANPMVSKDGKVDEEIIREVIEEEMGKDDLADKPTWYKAGVYLFRIALVFGALYFFLLSISLMGDGFKALTGVSAGQLFGEDVNPILGLMIGILATVLVQSSSTTTSVVVVLVGSGIVSVENAIPMIMGANIGTSVTNTIVSLGFIEDPVAYSRGFAGATVHDMFNYLNVVVLLPTELIVSGLRGGKGGPLQAIAKILADNVSVNIAKEGEQYDESNPIEWLVDPILVKIIEVDSDVIEDHAVDFPPRPKDESDCEGSFKFQTGQSVEECGGSSTCDWCVGGIFNETVYEGAKEAFDSQVMIEGGWLSNYSDSAGGIIAVVLSLLMLIASLFVIVKVLTTLIRGPAKGIIIKALNYNFIGGGYISILVGTLLTLFVQSSSITTSLLTPLVAVGAIELKNMYPFTLGANIGTTGTGLIAAFTKGNPDGLEIAFVHLFFNIFGVLIWYVIPFMRQPPIKAATFLGYMASLWKVFPLVYLALAFLIYPLTIFAISFGFEEGNTGGKTVAALFLIAFIIGHGWAIFFYKYRGGDAKFEEFVKSREQKVKSKEAEKIAAGGAEGEPLSV